MSRLVIDDFKYNGQGIFSFTYWGDDRTRESVDEYLAMTFGNDSTRKSSLVGELSNQSDLQHWIAAFSAENEADAKKELFTSGDFVERNSDT